MNIDNQSWEVDVVLGTSLVDMYNKCGRIDIDLLVFKSLRENSLIRGLALAKTGEETLKWFFKMEDEGIRPDVVTLIGVLCACSHSKLVEMGQMIFDTLLSGRYGFASGIKHYGCMVALMGRAGLLDVVNELMNTMPFAPNTIFRGSLLGGCQPLKGNLSYSELAAEKLAELEPMNVAHYVVLSKIYAEVGRWSEAEEVRRVMKERGFIKDVGWSCTKFDYHLEGNAGFTFFK